MKLTDTQKLVLGMVQNDAGLSLSRVGARCGLKERTVRAAVERLVEHEVIYPLHLIDIARLGFTHFNIFFSLALPNPAARDRLLSYLTASDRVTLLHEVGGEFDYAMSICAASIHEVLEFLEELGRVFGSIFAEKAVVTRGRYSGFGRKYFTGRKVSPVVLLGAQQGAEKIDETDHRVLKALARLHVRSEAALARDAGVPTATFRYRLEQLTQRGIVPGSVYAVTPWRYGYQSYRLLIAAASLSPAFQDALYQYAARHPQVVSLVQTLGRWDYELGVEVAESTHFPEIVQELKGRFSDHIRAATALPVFRFLKGVTYPFNALPEM